MKSANEAAEDRPFTFRRHFRPRRRPVRGLLGTTPWVDLVLLVLTFLITQSSFVVQPGVMLNLPASASPGHARYGDLVVTIPQEGMYFFNDERMTPDGLARALARSARANPGGALIVEADGRIAHRSLVEVYNMAAAAGIQQVLLATRSAARP